MGFVSAVGDSASAVEGSASAAEDSELEVGLVAPGTGILVTAAEQHPSAYATVVHQVAILELVHQAGTLVSAADDFVSVDD